MDVASRARVPLALAATLVVGCSGGGSAGDGHDATTDTREMHPDVVTRDAADATRREAGASDAPPDATPPSDGPDPYDGALWVNDSGDCGLGQIGAMYLGIPAYCQPVADDTDGFYQCDELANRFLRDALQHPDLDNVEVDFASSMCSRADTMSAYTVRGPGYGDTTGKTPVGGDLIVYPGTPGHVAIVVGFATSVYVTVLQQNDGPTVFHEQWDPVTSFFVGAECWIHADPAPPAELSDASACACFTGGDTCGLAVVDHEWWNGCRFTVPEAGVAYDGLYACDGGVVTKVKDCPSLCITPNIVDASGSCGM